MRSILFAAVVLALASTPAHAPAPGLAYQVNALRADLAAAEQHRQAVEELHRRMVERAP